jgi:hypothetical protein
MAQREPAASDQLQSPFGSNSGAVDEQCLSRTVPMAYRCGLMRPARNQMITAIPMKTLPEIRKSTLVIPDPISVYVPLAECVDHAASK